MSHKCKTCDDQTTEKDGICKLCKADMREILKDMLEECNRLEKENIELRKTYPKDFSLKVAYRIITEVKEDLARDLGPAYTGI